MAVFTPLDNVAIESVLHSYGAGALESATPVEEGTENTNYKVVTSKGKWVLTLFERRSRLDALPWIGDLMDALSQAGLPCPAPRLTKDTQTWTTTHGDHTLALLPWLPGKALTSPTADHARQAGEMLARLHLAASHQPGLPNPFGSGYVSTMATRLYGEARKAGQPFRQMIEALFNEQAWRQSVSGTLPRGPGHLDFFVDNVLFDNDRISGLIDFYFAASDAWAYDLAIALTSWGFDSEGELKSTHMNSFYKGYASVRPLHPEEVQALPHLLRLACCRFLASRLEDWLHPTPRSAGKPKDPSPYMRKLTICQRIHNLEDMLA